MNENNPFSLTTLVSGYPINHNDAVNAFVTLNDFPDNPAPMLNSSKNCNAPDPPL